MVLFLSIYLHYNTVYTHPTSSGNKHIPSGGSAGQILRWSSDGTAVWGSDNNTTYSTGTSSASGLTKLYSEEGDNEDGTLTQKFLKHMLQTRVQGFTSENHNYMIGYQLLGSNKTKPLPWIKIDNSIFYLMPNNLATSSACRILDINVDWSVSPWKLKYSIYINGVVYTKYLNFDQ